MPDLAKVLDSFAGSEGRHWVEAPRDWMQGRTLYGGMTAALCAHAAARTLPDLPPLRSLQVTFIGPAAGRLEFHCALLRRGRSSGTVEVDCRTNEGSAARVLLTYAADRESAVAHDTAPMPEVPEAADSGTFHGHQNGPAFTRHFDYALAAGSAPMSGGEPEMTVWSRLREPDGVDPAVALLALADALPPAAMAGFAEAAPISTMTWAVDFQPPLEASEWYLLQSVSEQARGGYSMQRMNIWEPGGRRLAAARQVVALFA